MSGLCKEPPTLNNKMAPQVTLKQISELNGKGVQGAKKQAEKRAKPLTIRETDIKIAYRT